jgi:hypothetical protein
MRNPSCALLPVLLLAALLTGCNFPTQRNVASVQTAAALTVAAQLTAAAPRPTATSTLAPFPTLPPATAVVPSATLPPAYTATSTCDNADFQMDVTYPDDTSVDAGSSFTKTWRFKNSGACSWTPSYALVFVSGQVMGGPAVQALTGNVNPGQTVDLSANLTAPAANGSYQGNWGIRNGAGVIFAHFWVKIKVEDGTGGPFAVTHVTYSLSTGDSGSHHDCPKVTAHITTNGAGDIQYHWTYSDGGSVPVESLHFAAAGTKDVEQIWELGPVWAGTTHWMGIYIDDPNHQDFGHKEFNTACSS